MRPKDDLSLRRDFASLEHEAILNVYVTGDLIKKHARKFFKHHGVTDVQYNVLELLRDREDLHEPMTQADLSRMMLVNPSNITSVLDRMERDGLVMRLDMPKDRRSNEIRLTDKGVKLLGEMQSTYMDGVKNMVKPVSLAELKQLIEILQRIRAQVGK